MSRERKISVIGLGKLGSPLAAVLASKGHFVTGLDLNENFVHAINQKESPVDEPGLQSLLNNCQHLSATTSYEEAILNSDISFIIVPTPSLSDGMFSNEYVLKAVTEIGKVLQYKTNYHLVVITSTVMPGSTDTIIKKTLESAAHKKVGEHLGLCYNPEFIALGSVIKNMLTPDMILIGESDPKAGELLASIYQTICENNPPIRRMNLTNAEITKIAVNTYITTKISFANMLSDLCDRIPDADVDVVTNAMGLDQRIGSKYLKAATAYGGPCFPRDNVAFSALAKQLGARSDLANATDAINQFQIERVISLIKTQAKTKKIGILGLAYKAETYVVEESFGVALANYLAEDGYTVSVHDPKALSQAERVLHASINKHVFIEDCVNHADIIIISTNWPEYQSTLTPALLERHANPRIIIDCWRVLSRDPISQVAEIIYLGYGNDFSTESMDELKYA